MNVEDEYFSAIENRDTAIMQRDKKIAERDKKLAEQSNQLAEQSNQLDEQKELIEAKDVALRQSAKALLKAGLPVEQVAEMTRLSIDDILSL